MRHAALAVAAALAGCNDAPAPPPSNNVAEAAPAQPVAAPATKAFVLDEKNDLIAAIKAEYRESFEAGQLQ